MKDGVHKDMKLFHLSRDDYCPIAECLKPCYFMWFFLLPTVISCRLWFHCSENMMYSFHYLISGPGDGCAFGNPTLFHENLVAKPSTKNVWFLRLDSVTLIKCLRLAKISIFKTIPVLVVMGVRCLVGNIYQEIWMWIPLGRLRDCRPFFNLHTNWFLHRNS